VRAARRPPAIPLGPVFVEYGMRPYDLALGRLLDDPEMREFLAAVPQAGRLLGALWRKLTTEPLPEVLRPPPKLPCPAEPAASGPPGPRGATLPDGAAAWKPMPSYPRLDEPPPVAVGEAPRPPEPERKQRDYLWIGRFLMR
jgi:hypothetical protein